MSLYASGRDIASTTIHALVLFIFLSAFVICLVYHLLCGIAPKGK